METITVSIVGASGYAGGELLRLLLFHPHIKIQQVTSERYTDKFVYKIHPNLRSITTLKFSSVVTLEPCDILFLSLPHGKAMTNIDFYLEKSKKIIDLSSDFRLNTSEAYQYWYKLEHSRPELLSEFVYGIPEIHRKDMQQANLISSAGCNATASITGLYPLYMENLLDTERTVIEVKVGSSEGGNKSNPASHHPERSGSVRSYKPTNHRHVAEIVQELTINKEVPIKIFFSATSIEMVRGVLATCHVFMKEKITDKDLWKLYRQYYNTEPFIRVVKERDGIYRYPEPKLLIGSNYCDIGFEVDGDTNRVVIISALDNLMKGAAGQAVQALNIMQGWEETTGLQFPGLHPI